MTDEQKEKMIDCGRYGFMADETAAYCGIVYEAVYHAMRDPESEIFKAYTTGRMESELALRKSIMTAAKEGNAGAIAQMKEYFKQSDFDFKED